MMDDVGGGSNLKNGVEFNFQWNKVQSDTAVNYKLPSVNSQLTIVSEF